MTSSRSVPTYAELPLISDLGLRTSWGVFDRPGGTLNFIGDDRIKDAAANVAHGQVISLSVASDLIDPPLYDRPKLEHVVTETARNIFEDELHHFNPQAGSQWDGLCHIRAREFGFYGGITDQNEAREQLGIHVLASQGVVGRGVLVDVAGFHGPKWDSMKERSVGVAEIQEILRSQKTELQAGDILCIRFGWIEQYRRIKADGEILQFEGTEFAGLSAADEMAEFLWDSQIAAVATDNPGVESSPGSKSVGSLHRKLIPGLGYPLAELLDLDTLAAACKESGRFDFLFTAAPLPLQGGASSTANALAIL